MVKEIYIYLRAWWPQWLFMVLTMGTALFVFWGVQWDLLISVVLLVGFLGFLFATFIRMAFAIFD